MVCQGWAMALLVFKMGTSAFSRFKPAIEVAAAGLLRDFGVDEQESRELAAGICGNLPQSLLSPGAGAHNLNCVLKRDGETVSFELACDGGCDLSGTAEIAERIIKKRKSTAGVRLEDGNSRLVLQLRISEGE